MPLEESLGQKAPGMNPLQTYCSTTDSGAQLKPCLLCAGLGKSVYLSFADAPLSVLVANNIFEDDKTLLQSYSRGDWVPLFYSVCAECENEIDFDLADSLIEYEIYKLAGGMWLQ